MKRVFICSTNNIKLSLDRGVCISKLLDNLNIRLAHLAVYCKPSLSFSNGSNQQVKTWRTWMEFVAEFVIQSNSHKSALFGPDIRAPTYRIRHRHRKVTAFVASWPWPCIYVQLVTYRLRRIRVTRVWLYLMWIVCLFPSRMFYCHRRNKGDSNCGIPIQKRINFSYLPNKVGM